MNHDQPKYEMTAEFRPEDSGQELLRNRIIKKTMVQDYQFSYMDCHMLLQANKKALQSLHSQRKKLDMDIEEQEKQVKKWEDEIAALHQEFPELAAEGETAPQEQEKLPEQG